MEKIQEILNKGWKPYNKNHKVVGYKKKAPKYSPLFLRIILLPLIVKLLIISVFPPF